MKKTSVRTSLILLFMFVMNAVAFSVPASASTSASCSALTDPYSVTSTSWGTPGSPESVYPGDQDVPFSVTLLFSGPCNSPQNTFQLLLSQGNSPSAFTGQNGDTEPSVVALSIDANTLVTETFYLNVSPTAQTSAAGVTYDFPMNISYLDNNASNPLTQIVTVPVSLYGQVDLKVSVPMNNLVAGQTNSVAFSISNTGTGNSGAITTTVSGPSTVTVLDQPSQVSSLEAGSNVSGVAQVFVPSSLSGTPITLSLAVKYLDAYGNSQTVTQNVLFTVGNPVTSSSSFLVEGANWGSATSTTSPLPGSQDTSLVVSMQYLGASPVTSLEGTVQLPAGFTDLNGHGSAVAYSSAATSQYGAVTLTFYLDIAGTVQPGSYNFTLDLEWMTPQSLGLEESAVLSPPPVASLESSFQVEGATWGTSTSAGATAVLPTVGTQGQALEVTLQYLGTSPVTTIEGTLTLPAGITDLNGGQTATAYAATATTDQVVTLTFYLDLGSGLQPGSYTFPLTLSWFTSGSVPIAQSSAVSPPPIASQASTSSFPLTLVQANSIITAGTQTSAEFTLTNGGTSPIFSPTFSLIPGSTVVISSMGSSVPTAELAVNGSTTFVAQLTSDPSATPGIYSGTLAVDFTDSDGVAHSQSFPVIFTVEGTVILVLQDTAATQSLTGFTVTGSILNEGTVAAYYASIGGLLDTSSASPVYLGEIDPNTPLPFSVTIPFTAPLTSAHVNTTTSATVSFSRTSRSGAFGGNFTRIGNFSFPAGFNSSFFGRNSTTSAGGATISLSLSYKNTFGEVLNQTFPIQTTVLSASELSGGSGITSISSDSSSNALLADFAYGVVVLIAVSLVIGGMMLRRYRARKLATLPPEARGEQSVI